MLTERLELWTDLSWLNRFLAHTQTASEKADFKVINSLAGPQADAYKRADYKSVGKKLRT